MIKVSDYKVELSEYKVVKPFIEKWHYSHSVRGLQISQCFGLFGEDMFGLPKLIGGMIYGVPSSRMGQKSVRYGNKPGKVLELKRLCCIDDTPTNTESYFIGKTLKWLSKNTDYQVVVSYADPDYGHSGTIYKASNFIHYGMTGTDKVLMVDGEKYHRRFINRDFSAAYEVKKRYEDGDKNVYFRPTPEKHIYIYYLDKKLKRKNNVL
jgi:hypothetical protein